ncbi:MAG: 16S rRNA (cytosine(1402)-N(4))-methyltransferase RsmH [Marinilabiliaceae bacterium]|nr:16S rRNA (cytosine(1402)-N(4))-methyltransferase RsmH [Marinilabiliaceae bacterium]
MEQQYHIPVLLHQSIEGLDIKPDGVYVDLTFGGGGHSREILSRLDNGRLVVFDQDPDAFLNRPDDSRLYFVRHNFKYLTHFLRYLNIDKVDGILGDLGVSSHHFDSPERGFSFRFEGALDMRMNKVSSLTAARVLNEYDQERLYSIFRNYGEIKKLGRLVNNITSYRSNSMFETTTQLKELVEKIAPPKEQSKFLAQVFQALRIEVNGEMDVLKSMLHQSVNVIKPGGRLVVISYHSLEDRMVKNFFKTGDVENNELVTDLYGRSQVPFEVVNRKVIVPGDEEISDNSRARSAKMRVAIRTNFA